MHRINKGLSHARILVAEDEIACRIAVRTFLESAGGTVTAVSSAEEALKHLATDSFNAIVTDMRMNGMDGIEFLKRIRSSGNDVPVIIMTGYGSMHSAIAALKLGADDYLLKPITKPDPVVRSVKNAIDRFELRTQNAMLRGQLAESELSFQTVFDHTADMVLSFALQNDGTPAHLDQTNVTAAEALGYTDEQIRELTILDVISRPHHRIAEHRICSLDTAASSDAFETMLVSSDGRHMPVEMHCHALRSAERTRIIAIARNTTDRVEIEARFANMVEEERTRMGRELHDVLCQDLASIEILAKTCSGDRHQLQALSSAAASALASARKLSKGLLPAFQNCEELLDALEEFLRTRLDRSGIDYELSMDSSFMVTDTNNLLHIFRIVQEATNNTLKHGRATSLNINFTSTDGVNSLTVSDNGVGVSRGTDRTDGMGSLIMKQRARVLGASLTIWGNKDTGTIVECCWEDTAPVHA